MDETKAQDMAIEIGQRCRRVRMAKGLSQQELADLAGTTPQNISKYEKKGISDIYWIKILSNVLESNLLEDETDQEGVVGEIGKEILYILICNNGYKETFNILNREMYGLSQNKISHEIFKLERIGMVVREQYKGWEDDETDMTFITAKGLITLKNMQLNENMSETVYDTIDDVSTYEQIIEEEGCYQNFIDKRPAEKLIRQINYWNSNPREWKIPGDLFSDYRCNYVKYLKKNYEEGFEEDGVSLKGEWDKWVPGENIYHDIIFRMALDIRDESVWLGCVLEGEQYLSVLFDLDDIVEDLGVVCNEDLVVDKAKNLLGNELGYVKDISRKEIETSANQNDVGQHGIDDADVVGEFLWALNVVDDSYVGKFEKKALYDKEVLQRLRKWNADFEMVNASDPKRLYEQKCIHYESVFPTDWFTTEEIRDFITEVFRPAQTAEEKEVDRMIAEINRLVPETLDYYRFPKEWEENGLADLVRKNYNIPKISES